MKIMEIVSQKAANGAIHHCLLLTRELVRRGHHLTVVCLPDSWIAHQLVSDQVEVIHSDLHRWPPDELWRIAAIVKNKQIDLIHTHLSRAHFFGVLLRRISRVPCIATAHSQFIQLHWMLNDLVIAVSEAARRFHCRYNFVRPSRIITIHNFIDSRQAKGLPEETRTEVRASLGISKTAKLVGIVGNIIPRKGHLYLIKALPKVLEAVPEVKLVIIGDPVSAAYTLKARAMAEKLGVVSRIIWTGFRSDVYRFMRALDLCVVASLQENFPNVILEAMASGLPVVATAVGGVGECVVHGETGLVVRPADSNALASALIELLKDPVRCRQFGEKGYRRVNEVFSLESKLSLIEAAFRRVLERTRPA